VYRKRFIVRLGITRIFPMSMVVMVRLLDVDGSDSSIFRCGMKVIMQIPIIAIAIFILVDDRWGLALTWDVSMATMCKGKYNAGWYFGYMNYCYQR
jgi:hypothetical protein